jgi:hypothetical protein
MKVYCLKGTAARPVALNDSWEREAPAEHPANVDLIGSIEEVTVAFAVALNRLRAGDEFDVIVEVR